MGHFSIGYPKLGCQATHATTNLEPPLVSRVFWTSLAKPRSASTPPSRLFSLFLSPLSPLSHVVPVSFPGRPACRSVRRRYPSGRRPPAGRVGPPTAYCHC